MKPTKFKTLTDDLKDPSTRTYRRTACSRAFSAVTPEQQGTLWFGSFLAHLQLERRISLPPRLLKQEVNSHISPAEHLRLADDMGGEPEQLFAQIDPIPLSAVGLGIWLLISILRGTS